MPRSPTSLSASLDEALRQWPTFAGLGILQLVALAVVFGTFVATEFGLLLLLNTGLEPATTRLKRTGIVDQIQSVLLSFVLTLTTVSYLKLLTTGVHLRSTEAGFLVGSLAQLAREAMRGELRFTLLVAALFVISSLMFFVTFRKLRKAIRVTPPRWPLAVLWLLALVGACYSFIVYPTVSAFAKRLVPEIYWVVSLVLSERARAGSLHATLAEFLSQQLA